MHERAQVGGARALALLLAATSLLPATAPFAQTVRPDFFITNGTVNAQALSGTTLYVGGSFSFVGAVTGSGVPVNASTGNAASGFPRVNGQVNAVLPDGSGGWYIGGSFSAVGGMARSNLARVLADNTVSPWDPGANGIVRALALAGGTVYIGGDFTTVGGLGRSRIAAVDTAAGAPAAWNPNANNTVRAITLNGGNVLVAGLFTSIGGQPRNRIAALSPVTGLATAWNPNANSSVFALAIVGSTVYAGGQFTNIGGQPRNRIAALDAVSGSVSAWNPNANNQVLSLAAGGGAVYAGGLFTSIGGQSRSRIAALSAATGFATSWNPNAGNTVQSIALDGATLYAGGDFLAIGGQSRSRVAAISVTTGLATSWDPTAYGTVSVVSVDGPDVFVGGLFNGVGGLPRNNLAAFDVTTGQATAWNPDANNAVLALSLEHAVVYAGGTFTLMGGQARSSLAALDTTLGIPTAWNPGADGMVSALAADGNTVYAGGLFGTVGGEPRTNLAAVEAGSGAVTSWDPGADDQVFAIERGNGTVYVGGSFASVGGHSRDFIAALDATSGLATSWDPGANGTVRTIVNGCSRIYAGGFFTTIGGQTRNDIAALDPVTGLATAWNPNANGPVFGVALSGGVVYAGGVLSSIGGQPRNRIAALDPVTGLATAWNPNCNGTVRAVAAGGGWAYAAGTFTAMGTTPSGNLAAVGADTSNPSPAIALTLPPLATGVAGASYGQPLAAAGGTAPYCYAVTAGSLPAGLALSSGTGQISGTPAAAGASVFTVTATDARGCTGSQSYTLSIFAAPSGSSVAADGNGICITPAHPCVGLPVFYTRSDAAPVRALSVTFQIEVSRISLCTPGSPSASIHPGAWLGSFTNSILEVTDNGGGSYTVDQALLGPPCGITTGGQLFVVDLEAVGPDGSGAITVTSVQARDCANAPIAVSPGAPSSVNILGTPIVVTPGALPAATAGAPYSQTFGASPGTAPFSFVVTAGALPAGLALAASGVLSGTPVQAGGFTFTVTATDAGGCSGSAACSLAVACPSIALAPAALPDGAVGIAYGQAIAATGGVAPYLFSVTAGALPPGITLSPAGVLSGTTVVTGEYPFTAGVVDAAGCPGSRAYTLTVACPAIAVLPATIPAGVAGVPYSQTLAAGAGIAPFSWAVTAGSLPAGLALDPASGEIGGTPTVVGLSTFTATVTDSAGCTGSGTYTFSVFAAPPVSSIAPSIDGLCLSSAQPCVGVPVRFDRGESTPARGASVTFEIDTAKLSLCTPATPASSVHPGAWLAGFASTSFQVTDLGGGRYTVDQAILGTPCGVTSGGVLFTIDLQAAGGDGSGPITVTSVTVRDCDNAPIGAVPGPAAVIEINNTAPAPITDLAAVQVSAGNGAGPTTGIALTWTTGGAGTVRLYRAPFGSYPLYDALGPVAPPDPSAAPGAPWTLVAPGATSGIVDSAAPRGFWHYVARVTNECGIVSAPSNMTAGTLDYLLGDVSNGLATGTGNNLDGMEDITLLGAHYGIGAATITARGVEYLDVGPTVAGSLTGRPLPDRQIDFEDLFVFAGNFGASVMTPQLAAQRAGAVGAGGPEEFRLDAPSLVTAGQMVTATLRLKGGGRIQGFSAQLAWDAGVIEAVGMHSGRFIEGQGGLLLSPRPGTVDAALLGLRERGISGEGEVASLSFRALRTGDAGIRLATLVARDAANRPVQPGEIAQSSRLERPLEAVLLAPSPNPLRGEAALTFALPEPGAVELAIYGVDGRRVRALAGGWHEAGLHHALWDGRDESRQPVAPGVYYLKLTAGGRGLTRKIVYLR